MMDHYLSTKCQLRVQTQALWSKSNRFMLRSQADDNKDMQHYHRDRKRQQNDAKLSEREKQNYRRGAELSQKCKTTIKRFRMITEIHSLIRVHISTLAHEILISFPHFPCLIVFCIFFTRLDQPSLCIQYC